MIKQLLAGVVLASFLSPVKAEEFSPVKSEQFVASYQHGSDAGRYGILVLGGSDGGLPKDLADRVADAGHSVLALSYFKDQNLPQELNGIPLAYFENAKQWLMGQPDTNPNGIIVVGWSKGAELALLLAARDAGVKGVVAIAPSSHVWAGILDDWQKVPSSSWTDEGEPMPHIPFQGDETVRSLRDLYQVSLNKADNKEAARIKVENINGPVLLFSGGQDTIWPASVMAADVCDVMHQAGKSCIHHDYPDAGHLLDADIVLGGDEATNAAAERESNAIIKRYLMENFR